MASQAPRWKVHLPVQVGKWQLHTHLPGLERGKVQKGELQEGPPCVCSCRRFAATLPVIIPHSTHPPLGTAPPASLSGRARGGPTGETSRYKAQKGGDRIEARSQASWSEQMEDAVQARPRSQRYILCTTRRAGTSAVLHFFHDKSFGDVVYPHGCDPKPSIADFHHFRGKNGAPTRVHPTSEKPTTGFDQFLRHRIRHWGPDPGPPHLRKTNHRI